MAQVRLSSADAARLAQRFGRGVEEFEQIDGMTINGAANRLGLDPEALNQALAANAARQPVKTTSGAKRTAKKAAKKK